MLLLSFKYFLNNIYTDIGIKHIHYNSSLIYTLSTPQKKAAQNSDSLSQLPMGGLAAGGQYQVVDRRIEGKFQDTVKACFV